jgi:hypothetical protein
MPKMEFPQFDGSGVKVWLDNCASYFHLYSISHDFQVTAASLHMVDTTSELVSDLQTFPWCSYMGTFCCCGIS